MLETDGLCVNLGWRDDLTSESVRWAVVDLVRDGVRMKRMRNRMASAMGNAPIGEGLLRALEGSA